MRVQPGSLLYALAVLLLAAVTGPAADLAGREVYLEIEIGSRQQLEQLSRLVAIDSVRGLRVRAYALDGELRALTEAGFAWQQLVHPGINPNALMGLPARAAAGSWDAYPTYQEYVAMMQGFAADYPELCRLQVLGATNNTIRPHQLLAVKISDNPDQEEDEPEVLLTSSMHGDETVGAVLLLRLVDELLASYDPTAAPGSDAALLTSLVNGLEIWINPMANPDGTYFASDDSVSGAQRNYGNPDGTSTPVNPNRNFPDPQYGDHPDGYAWWPETELMMDLATTQSFVLSANLHGGAEVVNYPWDTWRRRHADNAWFVVISRAYADAAQQAAAAPPYSDTTYLNDLRNGITNGYDWYMIAGGRQDYMTYWHGDREVTLEISAIKNAPASLLPAYWGYNRQALLGYLGHALEGVRGLVTDEPGAPLDATIEVAWYDVAEDRSVVGTDPEVGDYHRMLLPGDYWLVYRASGFLPAVRPVTVDDGPATRIDVQLAPDQGLLASLRGVVRGRSGAPVAGAWVTPMLAGVEPVATAADGSFLLLGLGEGGVLLEVVAAGYGAVQLGLELQAPETVQDIWLVPSPAPRRVGRRR